MSEQNTETKSKINPEIERIAALVAAGLSIDEQKKVKGSADAFEKSLPDDLSLETFEKTGNHIDNFVAGSSLAMGRFATEQVASGNYEEKDGRQFLEATIPLWGKNNVNISYTKEKVHTGTNPKNKEETITTVKQGDMRISLNMNADANRGQLKIVKASVNDMAEDAFAKLNK